jgi:DNA-binding NarL/FixJ family response regulator
MDGFNLKRTRPATAAGLQGSAAPRRALRDAGAPRSEIEVVELAANGLDGPQIARPLVLGTPTVRTHFALSLSRR